MNKRIDVSRIKEGNGKKRIKGRKKYGTTVQQWKFEGYKKLKKPPILEN